MRIAAVEITPGRGHGRGSGGPTGLDVTQVVTDKQGSGRIDLEHGAGMQDRIRIGLAPGQGIAGDQGSAARAETEVIEHWRGQPADLVGHHAPGDAARLEAGKNRFDAGIQRGGGIAASRIQVEVARQQLLDARLVESRQATAQDGATAGGDDTSDHLRIRRGMADLVAQGGQRGDQVGCRIGEGSIQVEKHGLRQARIAHAGFDAHAR